MQRIKRSLRFFSVSTPKTITLLLGVLLLFLVLDFNLPSQPSIQHISDVPLPAPQQINCEQPPTPTPGLVTALSVKTSSSNNTVTFDMKQPIYAVANGPIDSVTYVSGNWCAWGPANANDPLKGGRCPLQCPTISGAGGIVPITISQDKLSFSSQFDSYYPDNSGTCTYQVACVAGTSPTPSPTVGASPTPTPTGSIPTPTVTGTIASPTPSPTLGANPSPTVGASPTPTTAASPTPNPTCTTPIDCAAPPLNCNYSGGGTCSCGTLVCTSPTPTPNPSSTIAVSLDVTMPGIGSNTGIRENNSPKNRSRDFTVALYDASNKQVAQTSSKLTFNGTSYTGVANFSDVKSGNYVVKVKSNNSLWKALPGARDLVQNQTNVTPQVALVTGNIDDSSDSQNILDLSDYNALLSAWGTSSNGPADLNDDGIIDSKDLNILLRGFATRTGD